MMEGRWTIYKDASGRGHYVIEGPGTPEPTAVVPCDDAAVERAARALATKDGHWPTDANHFRALAEIALRAAGETT